MNSLRRAHKKSQLDNNGMPCETLHNLKRFLKKIKKKKNEVLVAIKKQEKKDLLDNILNTTSLVSKKRII